MAWTTARLKAAQDTALTGVTHVQWSENGTDESANLARTALTGDPKMKAATTANPSVTCNEEALETAACSADSKTITHFAFAGGEEGATLFTTWIALTASRTLNTGDKISVAAEALKENLYQATQAPA